MISVIICTYNRPKIIIDLVKLLKKQSTVPSEIIIVDSSDNTNDLLKKDNEIKYVKSSHKNQPYQRYLGFQYSSSNKWLLYLDDDMIPSHLECFDDILKLIANKKEYIAFALQFQDVNSETSLSTLQSSKIIKGNNLFYRLVRLITAYPILNEGRAGWNGVKGSLPTGGDTEWFSGGAFLIKKDVIFKNFNFSLFSIFEKQIGTGEDFIISYTSSKFGKIWATSKIYFYHNDQKNSNYTTNVFKYNRRLIYSRLYLSLEKARLENKSIFMPIIYYIYYSFWRLIGLIINIILNPNHLQMKALLGFFSGYFKSFELLLLSTSKEKAYWNHEILKDLNRS